MSQDITLPEEAAIIDYLYTHPDFFIRHASKLHRLAIPHPVKGAVSLVEWKMRQQQQRIQLLEEEITALMAQASDNEALFRQLLALQMELCQADSLPALLNRLQRWARGRGLAGATVRLFSDSWHINAPSEFIHLGLTRDEFEPIRLQRLAGRRHYLGPLNDQECALLLPAGQPAASVALSLFDEPDVSGLLIFTSRNAHHYQPGMGTALLDELTKWLPLLLSRWIVKGDAV